MENWRWEMGFVMWREVCISVVFFVRESDVILKNQLCSDEERRVGETLQTLAAVVGDHPTIKPSAD